MNDDTVCLTKEAQERSNFAIRKENERLLKENAELKEKITAYEKANNEWADYCYKLKNEKTTLVNGIKATMAGVMDKELKNYFSKELCTESYDFWIRVNKYNYPLIKSMIEFVEDEKC